MTPNIPDLLARLAGGPSPDDVPNLSLNQRQALYAERSTRETVHIGIRDSAEIVDALTPRIAAAEAPRPAVLKAQAEIEQLIEEQPEWHTIADSRARDREWGRQQDLKASRKALVNGVEYMGGVACVPNALKKILGVAIEADGREVPNWYGSLTEIDARIAELRERRDRAQRTLDRYVQQAEALLGAAVTE